MNLETAIAEKVHALPPAKQAEVLAFVEDLEHEEARGREASDEAETKKEARRLSIVGMFRSGKTDTSERAEEILAAEINRRSGWTLKDEIVD